ncbi:MAG TPA: S8 family serine peptidase [Nitriliruptorales bacterium]
MRVRNLLATLAVVAVATSGGALALAATDPYRSQQWNLDRIEAPMAWELSRGSGILVAVVDTGVDLEHPDLVDRIARRADGSVLGRDYVDDDDDPSDENGHGTLVAGVIAATADNGVGIAGTAPAAMLMPIRVLDAEGAGDGADVEAAIRWAVDNGAHVVNLSLESVGPSPSIPLPIAAPTSAVRYAWDRGVAVVAAAGNDSSQADDYPADSPVVIVGATTRDDQRASFSDAGRSDALMAPGVDIISTWWCAPTSPSCQNEHTYGEADGTSFAAPHVSGAVAILRSIGFSHEESVQRLRDTAWDIGAPGPDEDTGYGLIDLAAAAGARNPPSSPPPSPEPSPSPSPSPPSPSPPPPSPPAPPSPSAPASPSPAPAPSPSRDTASSGTGTPGPGDGATPTRQPSVDPTTDPVATGDRGTGTGGQQRALASVLLAASLAAHVAVRRRTG